MSSANATRRPLRQPVSTVAVAGPGRRSTVSGVTRAHVRPPASAVAAVALGGAVGASLRLALESLAPWQPAGFPWVTFGINVFGCLLIGALLAWLLGSAGQPAWLRPFLATGLLGGFTTFSAFAVESVRLLDAGAWGTAGSYVAGSLVLGLLAVRVGARLGERGRAR